MLKWWILCYEVSCCCILVFYFVLEVFEVVCFVCNKESNCSIFNNDGSNLIYYFWIEVGVKRMRWGLKLSGVYVGCNKIKWIERMIIVVG